MPLSVTARRFFNSATAHTTSYFDMFKTILSLLALGAAIAAIPIITGLVTATVASALSLYVATLGVIVASAIFNYCFAAQFKQATLSARPIEDNKSYGNLKINLRDMVSTLVTHANKKPGVKQLPQDILVENFRDEHNIKMSSVYGINLDACAIFIPSGVLLAHAKKLTKPEISALLMLEVIKIRNAHTRRDFPHIVANVGLAFISLLQDLDRSPFLFARLLGTLAGPLNFVFLFQASRNRTYHYEAMEQLVKECGTEYGHHLKMAYTKLGLPWENIEELELSESLASPTSKKAEATPKTTTKPAGFFKRIYKACADLVLVTAKAMKEIFSDYPSASNTMKFLEDKIAENPSIATPDALLALDKPMPHPKTTVTTTPTLGSSSSNPHASVATAANDTVPELTLPQSIRRKFAHK